ncbi:DUF5317 domain-containing protein [Candidatus Peregrinibacteria bacterium]|nr:DUF5317 domain-containing protein [Candidatus Peregrinibacteria bacterium]
MEASDKARVILLISVLAGIIIGSLSARLKKQAFQAPDLRLIWLAVLAFAPQFFAFYLPATREIISDSLVAICLVISQVLLFVFAYCNRKTVGMWLLIGGLVLNLVVISVNGGFMPISPETASHLVPAAVVQSIPLGSRFGKGKDIFLLPEDTHLESLSDRLLLPEGFLFQVAFSIGDILIAFGAFWMLSNQPLYRIKEDNQK